ncbi:MAG: histidine phosphatase family protein [Clostridia bacterium]|nr:histidine phosphatase family protein [Clostridia bacterium]
MSCTLYLIRHGQSLGNVAKAFLGHTDLDLSELGYRQAECTAKFLIQRKIDTVYSSDLLRAYNTCSEYLKLSNKTAIKDQNLREIFAGSWENNTFDTLQTVFNDTYSVWLNDIGNAHPNDGEPVKDLTQRVIKCITKIAEENDGKSVAIFTHATVIRSFFNYAYGNSADSMKNLRWATNASVSIAEFDNGKFSVIDYSIDDFLSDLKTSFPANV